MLTEDERPVRPQDLFGTWRLATYTAEDDGGGALRHPLGTDADGYLMYTPDGYMSVQMMRRDRANYDLPDISGGTTDQNAGAAAGFLAYCGPFSIDPNSGLVRHFVEVSLLPNWLRSVHLRQPTLDINHLTMHARYRVGAVEVRSVLTWNRAVQHDPHSLAPSTVVYAGATTQTSP